MSQRQRPHRVVDGNGTMSRIAKDQEKRKHNERYKGSAWLAYKNMW